MSGDSKYDEQYTFTIDDNLMKSQGRSKERAAHSLQKYGVMPSENNHKTYSVRCPEEGDR